MAEGKGTSISVGGAIVVNGGDDCAFVCPGKSTVVSDDENPLKIDKRYININIIRKPDELEDANFPPHVRA